MEKQELYDTLNQVLDILEEAQRLRDINPAIDILTDLINKISYER
jgi:hypothetical protein